MRFRWLFPIFKIENHSGIEAPVVEQPVALRNQLVTTNNGGTVTRPIRKPRRRDRKKPKKKGCCARCCSCWCCCKSGDRVAGTDSGPDTGTDSETEQKVGCCSCCCPGKKKRHEQRPGNKSQACVKCCKRFTTFIFSHIGLCSLVVGYSVLGGFIFMKLESPAEVVQRSHMESIRKHQVRALWNLTLDLNILYEENWTRLADEILVHFQTEVYTATKTKGWDGKDGESQLQWSFAGALLYSVTVITTIGYGHIAPKTDYGRLVTIFYALVGIPLTLLCLANLGSFMGDCFRCLYKHVCTALMWLCCPPQARAARAKHSARMRYRKAGDSEEENPLRSKHSVEGEGAEVAVMVEEDEKKPAKEEPVRVPMFVSIMIIAIYIFGGAVIFSLWEDEWDYLIGSYFCFITLSTIGFGDYVPGAARPDEWDNQEKLIICAFYLFFGLSLIAMCFNLMQEEVRAKCRWLGNKLGILEEKT